jgi:hypothetical protein
VIVVIASDRTVRIENVADLRAFKIHSHLKDRSVAAVGRVLIEAAAGRTDSSHAWVKMDWLLAHSGQTSSEWRAGFDKMLAFARSAGFVSPSNEVRGHIEWETP